MDIVVFGAGSLGSLVGGLLAREHDVTLVGRNPHVDRIERNGLRIDGELDAHVFPTATTDGTGLDADLAVVTVKAFDTDAAARTLATGSLDAALSLQNGMGNEATLATHLDCPVFAGTITYGAMFVEPGRVECTGIGELALGPRDGGSSPLADRIGTAFGAAAIETTVAMDMPRRLWRKLAVNTAINPVTALARVENGAILDPPTADLAAAAARETAQVARADGVELTDTEATGAVESVATATAANRSSMLQDVESDARTEVDAISGYVVDRGEELGVDTPTNRTLATTIRTWERGQDLR
ncbi:2-dehydropantoate 2-reductase [Halovivax ruber XH-70]|uniref:2-dehydropantoate 2-reductase n=1 Tax=Halovivax ruber (strain DSM 18193 / JCM 13892 / XH-70) TaxID=797302 RepID=L0IFN7_HALRX|nr:2-dehydropantoate 2-reductase [Halovivax ruber]AGB17658.1 2-dehydropantoate 2-reductase [Halovivax ruber XH-70]